MILAAILVILNAAFSFFTIKYLMKSSYDQGFLDGFNHRFQINKGRDNA